MEIIYVNGVKPKALPEDCALCIGNFDGIHRGHQELLKAGKRFCSKLAVMTFEPHPEAIIKKLNNVKLLTPGDEKIKVFEDYGVDILLIVKFDEHIMNMSKHEFIEMLEKLKFKRLVCGHDFRFGYMGMGDVDDLRNAFETDVIAKYEHMGKRISSSAIREALSEGDIELANGYLGRLYHLYGEVIHGSQMGRQIGFPTANIDTKDFYLPKNGVYICEVYLDGNKYYGMLNVGHNPTMNFQDDIRVEVNIFEFDMDIYGRRLDVYIIERVRPEKKFLSVDELKEELKRNKEYGMRKYLG